MDTQRRVERSCEDKCVQPLRLSPIQNTFASRPGHLKRTYSAVARILNYLVFHLFAYARSANPASAVKSSDESGAAVRWRQSSDGAHAPHPGCAQSGCCLKRTAADNLTEQRSGGIDVFLSGPERHPVPFPEFRTRARLPCRTVNVGILGLGADQEYGSVYVAAEHQAEWDSSRTNVFFDVAA